MYRWIFNSPFVHFRHLVAMTAAMILTTELAPVCTADANPDNDHLLVLDLSACQGDMFTIGECLNQQNEKADRWLQTVVQSYARLAARYMEELKQEGTKKPFDQVAQLRESQALFEQFRDATAALVYRTGYPGSGSAPESAKARFRLTVDRARFLLSVCNYPRGAKLPDTVDLTITDWCEVQ
jgi:uncharacterized protein YecT (DUF1311 family)